MRKYIVIIVVLMAAFAAYQLTHSKAVATPAQSPAAVVVGVTTVQAAEWQPYLEATGSLRPFQGVNVTAQEAGMVTEIHFESGRRVNKGDLLLQQYDLDERFALKSTMAQLGLARKTNERSKELIGNQVVSQSQLDMTSSEVERLSAEVERLEGAIAKRAIRAPFAGILGIRRVNVGQHIEPGDDIVTLESLDPIYVDFSLPQNRLTAVRVGQTVEVSLDTYPGMQFAGTINAIEPRVDPATRSFQLEAELPNADAKLRPGMFVNTRLLLAQQEEVFTVPQAAITYNPYGNSVFTVVESADGNGNVGLIANSVYVTLGEKRGDQIAILSGLSAGDRVVIAGQLRLRNGSPVKVDETVAVGSSVDPQVTDS